jgi:hypothetical protein
MRRADVNCQGVLAGVVCKDQGGNGPLRADSHHPITDLGGLGEH